MGSSDRPRMTVRRKVAYAIVAIVVLVAVVVAVHLFRVSVLGNEPPIRVKNGSMDVCLPAGNWKDGGDNTNEPDNSDRGPHWYPSQGKHNGRFLVTVTGMKPEVSDCKDPWTATGTKVDVSYSSGGRVSFRASKGTFLGFTLPGASLRTRVRPQNKLAVSSDREHLTYETNDPGHISKIEVRDGANVWECTFKEKDLGLTIDICSADTCSSPCK